MTEFPVFECNATGERFGAKNGVLEFDVRRHGNNQFDLRSRTVHIAIDALADVDGMVPHSIVYVGAEGGEIVGAVTEMDDGRVPWRDRGSVVIDHYEGFFQFVEEEVLY